MPYEKGRKEQTHKRVVEIAAEQFRAQGIEPVSIAGLMSEAGLTHGGFYAHFRSKDALVREALAEAHASKREDWLEQARGARERGEDGLEAIVRRYLSMPHRNHPGKGCSVAALAPEVARNDPQSRDIMAQAADEMVEIIVSELPSTMSKAKAREAAYSIFALMIGTLQLARVTADPALAEAILLSGQDAALRLAQRNT
ncbi:TetR/AcrR family transcriptional regulator [Microvirga arabica]|uniref:TetR/AcrR family transcriptional regulator n=1 Tax=Microvirga arabica TaxID=1128671 RepID=UPI0019397F3C|nr:TetR/AcrR family transcriptional regulator [Microvirga arabica]MBM1169940.1 TetR/AcrR family transcriptional regulator [Microvirga arabica]